MIGPSPIYPVPKKLRSASAVTALILPASAPGIRAPGPSLVRRRELHPDAARLSLAIAITYRLSNPADFYAAALKEATARHGGPDRSMTRRSHLRDQI
jgi:hypothetical protein